MPILLQPEAPSEIDYPSSDGKPMAETGFHLNTMLWLRLALEDLRDSRHDDSYIATDMFWYWEEGNPKACVAPDMMIIPGAGKHERYSFFTWREEGRIPAVVFEIASKSTWRLNLGKSRFQYEKLGVAEYFLFDPLGEHLEPRLRLFQLTNGRYVEHLDQGDGLVSKILQARFVPEATMLRVIDLIENKPVLTRSERVEEAYRISREATERVDLLELRAGEEKTRADAQQTLAEQLRQSAEQEKARAEEERIRTEQEKARAEHEKMQAEKERALAEEQRQRADLEKAAAERERERSRFLNAEVARLKEILQKAGIPDSALPINEKKEDKADES